jgi:hypothetical protein
MKITRTSQITGIERTLDLDITEEQYQRWESGELIQKVMPNLTEDEREFIITGISKEEWDEIFSDQLEEDKKSDIY